MWYLLNSLFMCNIKSYLIRNNKTQLIMFWLWNFKGHDYSCTTPAFYLFDLPFEYIIPMFLKHWFWTPFCIVYVARARTDLATNKHITNSYNSVNRCSTKWDFTGWLFGSAKYVFVLLKYLVSRLQHVARFHRLLTVQKIHVRICNLAPRMLEGASARPTRSVTNSGIGRSLTNRTKNVCVPCGSTSKKS